MMCQSCSGVCSDCGCKVCKSCGSCHDMACDEQVRFCRASLRSERYEDRRRRQSLRGAQRRLRGKVRFA